jgi:hypothetical protein
MHPLTTLEFSNRVRKRAQYEAFDFALIDGGVQVRNCSHANPDEHDYLVTITDGVPSACECPAAWKYEGACKHQVAVAIRTPIIEAARDYEQRALTDGGFSQVGEPHTHTEENEIDEVPCEDCIGKFPCWECYRSGRRELPE